MEKSNRPWHDLFVPPIVIPAFLAICLLVWLVFKPHVG